MKIPDQYYLHHTEVEAMSKYINIVTKYNLKATLFLTGKFVVEEWKRIGDMARLSNVELGGHSYNGFYPRKAFNFYYRLTGAKNGPYFLQKRQVRKTIAVFRDLLNYEIVSWRDHSYRHDKNTHQILVENGILFFSDIVSPDLIAPFEKQGLVYVPINTLPDHEHIYHGERLPGTFDESYLKSLPFSSSAMDVEDWLDTVLRQVQWITERGGMATILAHPACMAVVDGFKTFDKLCNFLKGLDCLLMKEIEPDFQDPVPR